jgi:hypothetical protein
MSVTLGVFEWVGGLLNPVVIEFEILDAKWNSDSFDKHRHPLA